MNLSRITQWAILEARAEFLEKADLRLGMLAIKKLILIIQNLIEVVIYTYDINTHTNKISKNDHIVTR